LEKGSYQGDAKVAEQFALLGVHTSYVKEGVLLTTTGEVASSFNYNFIEQPDLAQTFVVTCCLMNVPFSFSGLQSLKIKETDRIAALIAEMKKLGYILKEVDNGVMEWSGEKTQVAEDLAIDVYEDHRMAMAFAPAAIKIDGIKIKDPHVVSKSYPLFGKI
jgi:3-phosphoshikimate 1-carboxyvinyltransferase